MYGHYRQGSKRFRGKGEDDVQRWREGVDIILLPDTGGGRIAGSKFEKRRKKREKTKNFRGEEG